MTPHKEIKPTQEQVEAARKMSKDLIGTVEAYDALNIEAIAAFLASRDAAKDATTARLEDRIRALSDDASCCEAKDATIAELRLSLAKSEHGENELRSRVEAAEAQVAEVRSKAVALAQDKQLEIAELRLRAEAQIAELEKVVLARGHL